MVVPRNAAAKLVRNAPGSTSSTRMLKGASSRARLSDAPVPCYVSGNVCYRRSRGYEKIVGEGTLGT